jgi:hypothetical protein
MVDNRHTLKRVIFGAFFLVLPLLANAQSRGVTVIAKDGTTLANFSKSYALVIGESAYTAGWQQLAGVREDVEAVKRLFEEQGFTVETIENADSAKLKGGIEAFLNRYGYDEDTRLIVYYAGHGDTLDLGGRDMGYIVPTDAPLSNRDRQGFQQRAIPMQQFDTWAKTITSRHVLFMFDSCFSGSVFSISRAAPPTIDDKISQPVRQFISAGSEKETVPDKSIFRSQLEAALRNGEADLNRDGYVSGSELGMFLNDTVINYSNNSQHPQYGKIRDAALDKGDFVFEVGTAANVTIIPQPIPTPTPQPFHPAPPQAPQSADAWKNKWLYPGVRLGASPHWYQLNATPDVKSDTQAAFEGALLAEVQIVKLFAVQTELIFSGETVNAKGPNDIDVTIRSYTFTIPLLAKLTFRPGNFYLAGFTGPFFTIPLGFMEVTQSGQTETYDAIAPIGFTGGVAAGVKTGPGLLFLDLRYSGDFTYFFANDSAQFRRSMLSLSLGYNFGLVTRTEVRQAASGGKK